MNTSTAEYGSIQLNTWPSRALEASWETRTRVSASRDARGVEDADDVARAGRLDDAEEGPVEAVLRVQLDHLLVVVGALEQLDPRVERPSVRLEQHLHGSNPGYVRTAESAALEVDGP